MPFNMRSSSFYLGNFTPEFTEFFSAEINQSKNLFGAFSNHITGLGRLLNNIEVLFGKPDETPSATW